MTYISYDDTITEKLSTYISVPIYKTYIRSAVKKCIEDLKKGIYNKKDLIGIVPEHVIPVYCESWFPNLHIFDFLNLPYEKEECRKLLLQVTWIDEQEQRLLKIVLKFVSHYFTKSGGEEIGKESNRGAFAGGSL